MLHNNPIADAMLRSFDLWAKNDPRHRRIYKDASDGTKTIIQSSMQEMIDYRPSSFEHWWLKHHMRFREFKQSEFVAARAMMYAFLTKYCRGELNYEPQRRRKAAKASVE